VLVVEDGVFKMGLPEPVEDIEEYEEDR